MVQVDSERFAQALERLEQQFTQFASVMTETMARHDARLVEVAAEQQRLLKALANKETTVNLPERPKAFTVAVDGADGATRTMHIKAHTPKSH